MLPPTAAVKNARDARPLPTMTQAARLWRRPVIAVGGLMVVGLLLRLPMLGIGVWRDEGATYFDAIPDTLRGVLQSVTFTEVSPPGFFVVMHYWMAIFGSTELAFKVPALLFGLLLIPAVYALGTRATDSPRVGLASATIATFAAEAIYYSQEARPYTLAALLSCLVVLAFVHALRGPKRTSAWCMFAICAALLSYVHYTGLLLLGALAVVAAGLWWFRAAPIGWIPATMSFAAVFAAFLPWLPTLLMHLGTSTPWAAKQAWSTRPRLVVENLAYTLPLPMTGAEYPLTRNATILLVGAAFAVAIFRGLPTFVRTWREHRDRYIVVLAGTMLLVTGMLAGLSYGRRYMFAFVPVAWVLIGWAVVAAADHVRHLAPQKWNARLGDGVLVVAVGLLVVPNLDYVRALSRMEKSGIRVLAQQFRAAHRSDVLYIVNPDVLASTLGYYTADMTVRLNGFPRWSRPEVFSPHGYRELWEAPTLMSDVTRRIDAKAQEGYRRLVLVQTSGRIRDSGLLKMSRAHELFLWLQHTYPLIEMTDYPGWVEPVTMYVYALDASRR